MRKAYYDDIGPFATTPAPIFDDMHVYRVTLDATGTKVFHQILATELVNLKNARSVHSNHPEVCVIGSWGGSQSGLLSPAAQASKLDPSDD